LYTLLLFDFQRIRQLTEKVYTTSSHFSLSFIKREIINKENNYLSRMHPSNFSHIKPEKITYNPLRKTKLATNIAFMFKKSSTSNH